MPGPRERRSRPPVAGNYGSALPCLSTIGVGLAGICNQHRGAGELACPEAIEGKVGVAQPIWFNVSVYRHACGDFHKVDGILARQVGVIRHPPISTLFPYTTLFR